MNKVIVTGGAGFIGSHLSEELVKQGSHVIILDDLSSGKKANIDKLIASTIYKGSVEFVQNSVTNLPVLQTLFQKADYVFHLAAIASVPSSISDPLFSHEVNLSGTLNVLLAARDNNIKKVVFISSAAVYGDTPILPQREDMLPNPKSPYAVNKLTGEYYCKVFQDVYGLNSVCLRYFNVYGPRQDPNSQYAAVVPKFVDLVVNGRSPIIFGNGEQIRDFVFVRDAALAAIMAAESNATGVFNIASGKKISINKLVQLVLEVAGKDLEPVYQDSRSGDIMHSLADISKARTFGYLPRYNLEEGLREIISVLNHADSGMSVLPK